MFDFEKLTVYQKTKSFNKEIYSILEDRNGIDANTRNQLQRASFSVLLNIAEGTGRRTVPDQRKFFVIARGSIFESVAILDFLNEYDKIPRDQFQRSYEMAEEISKMLFALIKKEQD